MGEKEVGGKRLYGKGKEKKRDEIDAKIGSVVSPTVRAVIFVNELL